MKLRVYADTSAIAGCLDEEFRDPSIRLMTLFERGEVVAVLSDLTLRELDGAPADVRRLLDQLPDESVEMVSLTEEAAELAREYLRAGVVGVKMRVDAEHIAVATLARVDVLVSWNFKHIRESPPDSGLQLSQSAAGISAARDPNPSRGIHR